MKKQINIKYIRSDYLSDPYNLNPDGTLIFVTQDEFWHLWHCANDSVVDFDCQICIEDTFDRLDDYKEMGAWLER